MLEHDDTPKLIHEIVRYILTAGNTLQPGLIMEVMNDAEVH